MILVLTMPSLGALEGIQTVQNIHVAPGSEIKVGTKLLDVRLDLGEAAPQDCSPVSYFRLVSREKAWLRHLAVGDGAVCQRGQLLAVLSTAPQEPADAPPARALRISTASILGEAEWLLNRNTP